MKEMEWLATRSNKKGMEAVRKLGMLRRSERVKSRMDKGSLVSFGGMESTSRASDCYKEGLREGHCSKWKKKRVQERGKPMD